MKLKIKTLSNKSVLPTYANMGDAGIDLTASSIIKSTLFEVWYDTGITVEIPKGYFGLLVPRSSITKDGSLYLANTPGIIDSNFRGSIQVRFNRTLKGVFSRKQYKLGNRVAQLIILKYPIVKPEEVDELSKTDRGDGGFGSTGK